PRARVYQGDACMVRLKDMAHQLKLTPRGWLREAPRFHLPEMTGGNELLIPGPVLDVDPRGASLEGTGPLGAAQVAQGLSMLSPKAEELYGTKPQQLPVYARVDGSMRVSVALPILKAVRGHGVLKLVVSDPTVLPVSIVPPTAPGWLRTP